MTTENSEQRTDNTRAERWAVRASGRIMTVFAARDDAEWSLGQWAKIGPAELVRFVELREGEFVSRFVKMTLEAPPFDFDCPLDEGTA